MLKFNPELLDKKFIVVISKIDLIEVSKSLLDKVNKDFNRFPFGYIFSDQSRIKQS